MQRLLLGIRNFLFQTLEEHNITQTMKPSIHLTARAELNQYRFLQNTGVGGDRLEELERLNWAVLSPHSSSQAGLMRLSPDGEILVPQSGIYFVYSRVYFESGRSGRDLQFEQYLFKRTAAGSSSRLLAQAKADPCRNGVGLYSSQQGALFRLQRGDALALHVLGTATVHLAPESTYFGAFMIN